MALVEVSFKSRALLMKTSVNIILPIGRSNFDGKEISDLSYDHKKFPVLYLLHGGTDDHTSWLRFSSIERYAEEKGIAVVMPNAELSAYSDMINGHKYWTYISEELPQFIQAAFPISGKREDTFVAGLSMGGYGAFKLGLRKPNKFAAAASLSGTVDLIGSLTSGPQSIFKNVFGDPQKTDNSENDLYYLIERVANSDEHKPKLFLACGTEDFLYEDNVAFHNQVADLDIDLTYEEEPGGHEWEYWDRNIKRVLDWLPLKNS